jgi:hypothetical protein
MGRGRRRENHQPIGSREQWGLLTSLVSVRPQQEVSDLSVAVLVRARQGLTTRRCSVSTAKLSGVRNAAYIAAEFR